MGKILCTHYPRELWEFSILSSVRHCIHHAKHTDAKASGIHLCKSPHEVLIGFVSECPKRSLVKNKWDEGDEKGVGVGKKGSCEPQQRVSAGTAKEGPRFFHPNCSLLM